MAFDDLVRTAVDRITIGLRDPLEQELRAYAAELSRVVSEETATATVAELRAETERQIAAVRETAAREIDEIRRAAEVTLTSAHDELANQTKALEAVRADLATAHAENQRLTGELEAAQQLAASAKERATAEAEAVLAAQLASADTDHRLKLDAAIDEAVARHREREVAAAQRLRDAIALLDASRTLGEVLDTLTQVAGREVPRAAVLVVRGERLHGWRTTGFSASVPRASTISLSFDEAGIVGQAVSAAAPATNATPEPGLSLPAFARSDGGRQALAVPLVVGGAVVAVLYGDCPYIETASTARWTAVLDVLTRHASRALEAVTLRRAAGLATLPAVARDSQAEQPSTGGIS